MASKQEKRETTAAISGTWSRMLKAVLLPNQAVRFVRDEADGAISLTVPTRRPAFLFPPISWVIRPPKERLTILDRTGAMIWKMCDGRRTVEEIVERFAISHHLSFHESRVSVTGYMKSLLQRGIVAVSMQPED